MKTTDLHSTAANEANERLWAAILNVICKKNKFRRTLASLVKEKFNDDQFLSYISVVSASFKCGMSDREWRFSEKK